MTWLSDDVVGRLQSAMQLPDLAGTRYRAIQFLGRGGMSTVWLAEDTLLRRRVALKILALENSSAELASRLMWEAVVLARLEHPGIVPVHDAGTLADGRTFYCMKYVEGQTLDQHIAGSSLRERLHLLQRIAEPLAFAHARGIVHRDLKPANIMVGPFGEVLIMDWGLAKIIGPSSPEPVHAPLGRPETQTGPPAGSQSTGHGSVLGTPGHMAPEQARGDVEQIDQRTDVFALGAMLNFMLCAATPQKTSSPKPLAAICRKAMAAEMADRYESVRDLAADIRRYVEGESVSIYRESMIERAARFFTRHQAAIVLIVAYLLMRLLLIFLSRR